MSNLEHEGGRLGELPGGGHHEPSSSQWPTGVILGKPPIIDLRTPFVMTSAGPVQLGTPPESLKAAKRESRPFPHVLVSADEFLIEGINYEDKEFYIYLQ